MSAEVSVIRLDNPPVNGLGHAVRTAVVEGLTAAQADPAVKAIVIIGAGNGFLRRRRHQGVRHRPTRLREPSLRAVIRALEKSHQAGDRRDPRRGAWAAGWSSRSAATTASPSPARRSRCPR